MDHDYVHFLSSIGFTDEDAEEIAQAHADFMDEDVDTDDLNRRWGADLMMWLHEEYLRAYGVGRES